MRAYINIRRRRVALYSSTLNTWSFFRVRVNGQLAAAPPVVVVEYDFKKACRLAEQVNAGFTVVYNKDISAGGYNTWRALAQGIWQQLAQKKMSK